MFTHSPIDVPPCTTAAPSSASSVASSFASDASFVDSCIAPDPPQGDPDLPALDFHTPTFAVGEIRRWRDSAYRSDEHTGNRTITISVVIVRSRNPSIGEKCAMNARPSRDTPKVTRLRRASAPRDERRHERRMTRLNATRDNAPKYVEHVPLVEEPVSSLTVHRHAATTPCIRTRRQCTLGRSVFPDLGPETRVHGRDRSYSATSGRRLGYARDQVHAPIRTFVADFTTERSPTRESMGYRSLTSRETFIFDEITTIATILSLESH